MPSAMPQRSVTGTSRSRAAASQGGMTVRPSGLLSLAANFAVVLSPLTPTEHNSPEASNTLRFASRAMRSGVPDRRWQCVTSRKASSTENTSMSGVTSCNASMIPVEVAA